MIILKHGGMYLQHPTNGNTQWTALIEDARVFDCIGAVSLEKWEQDYLNTLTIEVVTIL